jgi:hypothetical protein
MADPLTTLMSVAGGALFGQLFGKKDKPEKPPEQAAPESTPLGTPNSNKPKPAQSFVSAAAVPQQQTRGQATLLGQ